METLFKGKAFKLHQDKNIGILEFDLEGEKINKFGEFQLKELGDLCDKIKAGDYKVKALLIRSAKKDSFIVGADINVIQSLADEAEARKASELGQSTFSKLEDLSIPTLVAIHGACMGGGTEMACAAKYRICSDSSRTVIGVPEVKLGFLPGWGGTYRLPKMVGLMNAIDMILSGKSIRPHKAPKMGLVDELVPEALFDAKSVEYTHMLAEGKVPFNKSRKVSLPEKLLTTNFIGKKVFFSKAREQLLSKTKGHYPAPLAALELIRDKSSLKRDAYMKEEARVFAQLWATPVSKHLVSLFFLTEDVKRDPGTTSLDREQLKSLPKFNQMAVLGAGVMGGGIGYQSASKDIYVTLKDIRHEAVAAGKAHAQKLFNKLVERKHMTRSQASQKMSHIRGQVDYTSFGSLDLVIEAVVEDLEIKKKVFAEVETKVSDQCVIATNTSSLRLEDMLPAFKKPERFVGLHFFNPVDKMPLVEVVTHPQISPETVARAVAYVKAIGKTPVVVKDGPGFLVNRLLLPWLNEAGYCLQEGYDIVETDKILKKFGMPMGPFELLDEIGLDVACKVSHILHASLGQRFKPSDGLDRIMEANKKLGEGQTKRLGKKSGLGFYKWENGRRKEADTEAIHKILFPTGVKARTELNPETLIRRLIYPMINETALILKEQIVEKAWQVDVGMIFGTGFPPFRGGLCRYADSVGLKNIESELQRMSTLYGARLKPTEALSAYAQSGGKFYD
ncbi:hypothetical protein GW915_04985 [bacterium]|nr:hypothetical protein [bacterium]